MFGNFNEEARNILVGAKKEMMKLKHPYVGSEHLLLSILKQDNEVSKNLKEYNLDYISFKKEIINTIGKGNVENKWFLYTPLLKRIIETAILDSKENNSCEVTIEHLFSALLEEGEGVAIRIIIGMNIDIDKLYQEFSYTIVPQKKKKKNKKLILDELGIDLTKKASNNELDPVIGREKEIKRVLEVLSRRTKNNPLLIGEAGVGKTAIVEELSRMIASKNAPINLLNKRIISLDMASAVAGTKYRGEFEERMTKIIKEVEENDDVILFIDEMHTLVGAGGAEGAIDASNIFKPALARGKLRCIGATTTDEYKKYIEKDAALERRFQKVEIDIPNKKDVKEILIKIKTIYEKYHKVEIEEEVIDTILELSDKYIYGRFEPDKSIDILDEVCAKVSLKETKELKKYNKFKQEFQLVETCKNEAILNNDFDLASCYKEKENIICNEINKLELDLYNKCKKIVTKIDVAEVINLKTKIPVYELLKEPKTTIKNIEINLSENIIGQENAIKEVVNNAKKIKLGFKDKNKCYSFMFMGPSGVGKTKLAKLFGECLVGDNNVIKLDMSEYSESHSVSKIVGAPPGYIGYDNNKNILEEIRDKPYSVLILDEIEKANQSVINLFYQILDEGKIKDSNGKVIRFDNVTIIMTSNIGFNDIHVGFNKKTNDVVLSKLKDNFSTSFVNRIDSVIVFNELSRENIEFLVIKKIDEIILKYKLLEANLEINNDVINEIIELSNYKEYGARKLDKIIKNNIENIIIDHMINNNYNIKINSIKEKVS